MTHIGGCACGQVRYKIEGDPIWTQMCYCHDCQRISGSAYGLNLMIPEAQLHIDGTTKSIILPTGSGSGCENHFCSVCATNIWAYYLIAPPGLIIVRAGTLDDTSWLQPDAQVFAKDKQPWVQIADGVPAYDERCIPTEDWPAVSLKKLTDFISANQN
jgi:hypothetical protein